MSKQEREILTELYGFFAGVLVSIFFLLKVFGIINWSWWWVVSPLWFPFVLMIIGAIIHWIIFLVWLRKNVK